MRDEMMSDVGISDSRQDASGHHIGHKVITESVTPSHEWSVCKDGLLGIFIFILLDLMFFLFVIMRSHTLKVRMLV